MSAIHDSEKRKAIIYCRVSDAKQVIEGHGLESQELRCRQYATQKGYDVAAMFPDTISGGGDFMQRPGMVSLLAFLDAQPDENFVVIFDDLKRFARDVEFHLKLRKAFRQRGATIECLNFKFDDTPEGEFIETILAAQGALERKQNGRQVSQKMKARMELGYWTMRNPVGYRYQQVQGHGKLMVRDEPIASMLAEMLEGYAMGRFETPSEAGRFLERQPDYPKPPNGIVRVEQVVQVLENPIYAGLLNFEPWGISDVLGKHEPLIAEETFQRIQQRRKSAVRMPARKDIGEDFALRGFLACNDCGVPFRSSWAKGRSKHYAYYLCQTKSCESYGKSIARDKAEADVGNIVQSLQPTQNLSELIKVMFRHAWDQREGMGAQLTQSLKSKIQQADRQIEKLLERIVESSNDSVISAYEKKIENLEQEKARHNRQMVQLEKPRRPYHECLEPALQFVTNPYKLWVSGDVTLRRIVLKLAFKGHLMYCRKNGARTAGFSFPFNALKGFKNLELQNGGA